MSLGVVGRKLGMTRVFTDEGVSLPVTVIHVEPNRISQLRSMDPDGYSALQVTVGRRRSVRVPRPLAGHFAKAGIEAGRGLWEFRLEAGQTEPYQVGSEFGVDLFAEGQIVDVAGISKGKGYAGTIKRHNFRGQDATHGNSLSHRVPGSVGQCQTPGRVFKGKKMAGQMGAMRSTSQNLEVVRVDAERNLLLVKGAVPGAKGGDVVVTPAVKAKG